MLIQTPSIYWAVYYIHLLKVTSSKLTETHMDLRNDLKDNLNFLEKNQGERVGFSPNCGQGRTSESVLGCHAWKTWVCWAFLDTIHTLGQFCTIAFWLGLKTWQGSAHTRHTRACSLLEISLVLLLGLVFPCGTCVDDSPSSLGLGALGLGTTLGLLACLAPT